MSFAERLGDALERTIPKVGPEAGAQLRAIISPTSLKIMAAALAAWAISHGFGVGEAIDIILGVVGALALGMAIFSGIDEVYQFAIGTYRATSEANLDDAADHLAKAIAILGVTAVLALLFRGRPSVNRRSLGTATPPRTPGWRYKPTTRYEPLSRGTLGSTGRWGDVRISTLGTATEQEIAAVHEAVHQWFTPKIYFLRNFRVSNMQGSYFDSSLWRYIEEALAQTIALVGKTGFSKTFEGIGFPVQNGYLFLMKAGGYSSGMAGKGLFIEGAGLIANGFIAGMSFELWFKAGAWSSSSPAGSR